jgi:hypothetical protein
MSKLKNKTIPARWTETSYKLKVHCESGVTSDLKKKLLNIFKDLASNKNQDLHLCNLIGIRGITGRRMEVKYPRKLRPLTWQDVVQH